MRALGLLMARAVILTLPGILAFAPAASATQAPAASLNPPPPPFVSCTQTGDRTICAGTRERVETPVDTGGTCGIGADAFDVYDHGTEHQRLTLRYDAEGNLESVTNHERWTDSAWSNPLNGASVPHTQSNVITTVLATPGDFGSATETTVGEVIFTDPATGKKVLRSVGRAVLGADGTVLFTAGKQPFLAGDPAVFGPICAALD